MKKIQIAIENPCHEDWNNMAPETQGRFCHSCEKIVIDFSHMSDSEILQFFNKPKTEKICGRFKSEQLTLPAESNQTQKNWDQSKFTAAPNQQPPLDWQYSKFQSPSSQMMPLHGKQSIVPPNANPQPTQQLLHFAYILVLVLGIGVASCNSDTTKGEILIGDTTAMIVTNKEETTSGDTTKNHSANKTHSTNTTIINDKKGENPSRILGKPKVQRIETIEPIIMGECVMPYEFDDNETTQITANWEQIKQHKKQPTLPPEKYPDQSQFTTGPYKHELPTPYNTKISKPDSTNNR